MGVHVPDIKEEYKEIKESWGERRLRGTLEGSRFGPWIGLLARFFPVRVTRWKVRAGGSRKRTSAWQICCLTGIS
jgi:hypothetical protein